MRAAKKKSRASNDREAADEEEEKTAMAVVTLSGSDDDEANKDLTLEIVAKSRQRRVPAAAAAGAALTPPVGVSSASLEDVVVVLETPPAPPGVEAPAASNGRRKSKPKRKKKPEKISEEVDLRATSEEPMGNSGSVITDADANDIITSIALPQLVVNEDAEEEITIGKDDTFVNDAPGNSVLRKLLRGPRYFDPGESCLNSCCNCGDSGHRAADCTMEKRQRPCFVCGLFGHKAQYCTQRRGRVAKGCPSKYQSGPHGSNFCLRCGDMGHDMLSCSNNYVSDDMKEIQCYICHKYGHLCCADFIDDGPKEVSCYNCAQPGHTGSGCAKVRGEANADTPASVCYKCGEGGHFARGCLKDMKSNRNSDDLLASPVSSFKGELSVRDGLFRVGQSSYPARKHAKKGCDSKQSKSLPYHLTKHQKVKVYQYEEVAYTTPRKFRPKGDSWFAGDPGDAYILKRKHLGWGSPYGSENHFAGGGGGQHYSSSQPPRKKSYFGYSASRLGRY